MPTCKISVSSVVRLASNREQHLIKTAPSTGEPPFLPSSAEEQFKKKKKQREKSESL